MTISLVRKDPQYSEGVEARPELDRYLQGNIKGLHIVGAANGSPLLKTCINEGVEVVRYISRLAKPQSEAGDDELVDLVIIGAGPAGLAAAMEASRRGYSYRLLEKSRPLDTIHNFPAGKHVYAEPASLATQGQLWLDDSTKEDLLEKWGQAASGLKIELGFNVVDIQKLADHFEVKTTSGVMVRGRRVILAIGRMGNPRRLNVPGEDSPQVYTKLLNPGKYSGKNVVVIGGGNSAAEAVLALCEKNTVYMVHRRKEFPRLSSTNRELLLSAEKNSKVTIIREGKVTEFHEGQVLVQDPDGSKSIKSDAAFELIGGDPPTAFLKRIGIRFEGVWSASRLVHLLWVFVLVYSIYGTKNGLWPFEKLYAGLNRAGVYPGMLYGLLYSLLMTFFGLKAMSRYRSDPYQQKRFGTLIAAQWIVYFALPWALWYLVDYAEFWRLWGVTLTYPLGYYGLWDPAGKLFSDTILPWALATLLVFAVFMPIFSIYHGKRFCSWFCPCGGLAETVGDAWRQKAPRGKPIRKLEASSTLIMIVTFLASVLIISDYREFLSPQGVRYWYKLIVDIGLASIVAITLYPFSGGRVWCRFFCPLAKWMELWSRWGGGKLAVVPNDECISCGECTRYCQMGIDVRAFAQRNHPLSNETTSCVFCGICVTVCPVDVLSIKRLPSGTRGFRPGDGDGKQEPRP